MPIRELLRDSLPPPVLNALRAYRRAQHLRTATVLKRTWALRRANIQRSRNALRPPRRAVIIPGDQSNPFGSCGEDAMITTTASMVLATSRTAEITVLVSSN